MNELWPHQKQGIADIFAAMDDGERRICVTAATGMGKTRMMAELLLWAVDHNFSASLYTNRKLLLEQLSHTLDKHDIEHGKRAAGHDQIKHRLVQLSSVQTENSRVYVRKKWKLHKADIVMVDEAHIQKGDTARRIMADHLEQDATVIGWTATPVDLADFYDRLIVAGTVSQGRECGALLPVRRHLSPDEPDLSQIKTQNNGEYSYNDIKKVMKTHYIWGSVYENWARINPDARPTLLFAPGVAESIWFAEQFSKKGVRAASIDGKNIWIDGEYIDSDQEARDQVIKEVESGDIKVLCNRFVLREGIDIPCLYHGIFATPFGSIQSYIQSGGRILRNHPSIDHVVISDHGGSWHRHGSLNQDRDWNMTHTANMISGTRKDRLRENKDPEPISCPKCFTVRLWGKECPECGYTSHKRSRRVVQISGDMINMEGKIYRPKPVREKVDTESTWISCYYRAKNSKNKMTFRQAEALFFYENHYYPPRTLPLMPNNDIDWYRRVCDVHQNELIPKAESHEQHPENPNRQTSFA